MASPRTAWSRILRRKQKPRRINSGRQRVVFGLFLFLILALFAYTRASLYPRVSAVAPANLNFQARLLGSGGAIVADGTYNVEFKLFNASSSSGSSQGSCSGDANCLWTETRTGGNKVSVRAGYLSVSLGSVTSLASVDFSQQLYLTMNIGGTGSPSWDGEMSPRLATSATPYSFRAAQADSVTITGGSVTGDNLLQKAPSSIQSYSSANAGLRLNQTGAGGILQLQGGGVDVLTVSKTGDLTLGTIDGTGSLLVVDTKNTGSDPAGINGGIYYNSSLGKFRCYQSNAWMDCIGGNSTSAQVTIIGGLANVTAGSTGVAVESTLYTAANAVANNVGVTGFTAAAAGSFRSCLIKNNAAIAGGTLSLRWRVNGASVGATACNMTSAAATNRQVASALNPGVVTFAAGDTIGIAFDTNAGFLPSGTNDFTVYWTIEYGNGATGGGVSLQGVYDASIVASVLTTNAKDITFTLANTGTDSNFLIDIASGSTSKFAVQNNGTDVLSVNSNSISLAAATTVSTGGLSLSSTGLTNVGAASGITTLGLSGAISGGTTYTGSGDINTTGGTVQTNSVSRIDNSGNLVNIPSLSSTAGLSISSGGAGDITLDSASNIIKIAATDTTLQRIASGDYTVDLRDAAATTLVLDNSDTGVASLDLNDGGLQTLGTTRLSNSGALQNITGLTIISGGANITGLTAVTGAITATTTITASGGTLTSGTNSQAGVLVLNDGSAHTGQLQLTLSGNRTYNLPDVSGTICLTSTCTGGVPGVNFVNGGNNFGGLAILGTNDNFGLDIYTNNTARIRLDNSGNTSVLGTTTLKSTVNSATAVQIQNSNADNVLKVDTTGGNQNNVVTNPSFEVNTTGWAAKGTPTTFARDTGQFFDGVASLKVTTQATNDQGAKYNIAGGLALSTRYSMSFYIRLDPTSITMATLGAGYSSDGATDNTACTLNTSTVNSNGWTKVNCSFTTPGSFGGTPYVYIKQTNNVIHSFYIDAVLLQLDTNTETNYRDGKISIQGSIVTPLILQNATNSTTALAVQNAAGTNIFSIDTTDTNVMITNPGFEAGVTGWAAQAGTTTIQRDTSQSWLGFASLQINTSNTANTGAKFTTANTNPTQLALSTVYNLSWYAKLSAGSFTDIKGRYSPDGGTTFVECTPTNQIVLTTGWTRYSCSFNSSATAVTAGAFIAIVQTAAPGLTRTFWIDGVQLELGNSATEYGAGSIYLNGTIMTPLTVKNKDNSTTSFSVQNSLSSALFQIDSLNNIVYVGSPTADATAVILVLDTKNTSGDPATGVNGAMYFNSSDQSYRCYRNVNATAADGIWESCSNNPIDHSWVQEDEFLAGGVATNTIGDLNWALQTITTAAVASYNNAGVMGPTGDRPGILRLRTNGNASRGSTMSLAGSNVNSLPVAAEQTFRTSVGEFKNAGANVTVIRIGLHNETTTTTAPTAGVWWEANSGGSANWQYCYGNGAAAVCAASAVAVADNTWYRLEARVVSATAIDFFINGTKLQVTGITLDVATAVAPALTCFAGSAVVQDCFLDYYQITGGSGASR